MSDFDDARRRVWRGVNWLSQYHPTWAEDIRKAYYNCHFDMEMEDRCVLGTIAGNFWAIVDGQGVDGIPSLTTEQGYYYGFNRSDEATPNVSWDDLSAAWLLAAMEVY